MEKQMPSFAKLLPDGRPALYLDNLLVSTFVDCPQKFDYRRYQNWVPKPTLGGSAAMQIGIWWSAALENFYREMFLYQQNFPGSREPSLQVMLEAGARAWVEHKMSVGEQHDGSSFEEKFNTAFAKFRGMAGAMSMLREYWEAFGENDAKHWKIVAMELGFGYGNEVLLTEENDDILVYWCGRPDLIVYEKNTDILLCTDHKSKTYMKSNFIHCFKPHPQTAGYVYALGVMCKSLGYDRPVDRCMINGAGQFVAMRPRKVIPRFLRPRPHYNPQEMSEWRQQTIRHAKALWASVQSDIWDRHETSCHVYAGCMYREVCNKPPETRPIILQADFVQVEPWKPYVKTEVVEDEVFGETE